MFMPMPNHSIEARMPREALSAIAIIKKPFIRTTPLAERFSITLIEMAPSRDRDIDELSQPEWLRSLSCRESPASKFFNRRN
jgi:hypothetical protein